MLCLSPAQASVLLDADDVSLTTGSETQSGNGQLDLILFGYAAGGGVTGNAVTGFNGDDANTQMPGGGTKSISGSYITSMGELRDFYRLNFPNGLGGSTVNEIVLFADLSETGQVNDIRAARSEDRNRLQPVPRFRFTEQPPRQRYLLGQAERYGQRRPWRLGAGGVSIRTVDRFPCP